MKLLLIDELFECLNLETMIKHHFPTCHILPSPSKWYEGLKLAKVEKPDILLVNLDVIGIDGMDILKLVREHHPSAQLIVYTATENFAYAKNALDMGVKYFFMKPISEELLVNALNEIWNEKQRQTYKQSHLTSAVIDRIRLHRVAGQNMISSLLLGAPEPESLNLWIDSSEIIFQDQGCILITVKEDNVITELYFLQIQKTIQELQHYASGIVKKYENVICILLFPDAQLTIQNYKDWLNGYIKIFSQKLPKMDLSFFVSSWAPSYENSSDLWNECQYLLNKDNKMRMDNILFFEKTPLQTNNMLLYVQTQKKVKKAILDHSWDEAENILTEWIRQMRKNQLQVSELNMLLNCIFRNCLSEIDKQVSYYSLNLFGIQDPFIEPERFVHIGMELIRGKISVDSQDHRLSIVLKALDFIWEYYSEDISLENVARYAEVSPFYLSRLLKKYLNFNFVQILTFARIHAGTNLLCERQDLTIRQISEQVGFSSESYFYKVYKKYTGITAGRLRELLHT